MRRKAAAYCLFFLLLAGYTAYLMLDTFVIRRAEVTGIVSASSGIPAAVFDPVITQDSYTDGSVSIAITTSRVEGTTVYTADITISSPQLLRTALADNTYGRNVTQRTSEMAEANHAILAINGDYYASRETGYVIRSGVLYRARAARNQQDLVIWQDGSASIITESEITAEELLDAGAHDVFSFGPALLQGGAVTVDEYDEVDRAMTSNPRTAIGFYDATHLVMIVCDGRTGESAGLSLYQLAEYAASLGLQTMYNLDGGGSSTMVFDGRIVNNPTTNGRRSSERSVSDIVYIGY